MRGGGSGPPKKEEKFPLFEKFPTYRGGGGGSEEIRMVSQLLPVLNYDSFPYLNFILINANFLICNVIKNV